jgi:hypothetical protein
MWISSGVDELWRSVEGGIDAPADWSSRRRVVWSIPSFVRSLGLWPVTAKTVESAASRTDASLKG